MTPTDWPLVGFQKRTVLAAPLETRSWPLAAKATPRAGPAWPDIENSSLASAAFQTLTTPSLPAPATFEPSGLRATALTASAAAELRMAMAVGKSQMRAVLSAAPEATSVPSGLTATLRTRAVWPFGPPKVLNSFPVAASHTLIVLSKLPVTTYLPSGVKAVEYTDSVCPLRTAATSGGGVSGPSARIIAARRAPRRGAARRVNRAAGRVSGWRVMGAGRRGGNRWEQIQARPRGRRRRGGL